VHLQGSTAGKAFDGQKRLFLFAIVMIIVGVLCFATAAWRGFVAVLGQENALRLVCYGAGNELFSGLFGIGGAF
jgi:uncharacterized protein